MKVRAITVGFDLPAPRVTKAPYADAAELLRSARAAFEAAGLEVQTTRACGPALDRTLDVLGVGRFHRWAAESEAAARDAGIDYLSLGRVPEPASSLVHDQVAEVLADGEVAFLSADLVDSAGLPSLPMAAACATAVRALADHTPLGFGNLRFTASASCPPNIPFLPAAYHAGGGPRFSVAIQAADVVLAAVEDAGSMAAVEERLVAALQAAGDAVEAVALDLEARLGVPYVGVDLSPAPFPDDRTSIGGALEAVGVDHFGAPGSLYAAAMVTRAIRRTRLRRSGFSGLMLPVLEDSVLARRTADHPSSLHELLLFSAVCGTGLDTVPLPGDIREGELAGAFLDVAALSVALGGKALTARFLPVPGAAAGAETAYHFAYFHNARVLPSSGGGAAGILARA